MSGARKRPSPRMVLGILALLALVLVLVVGRSMLEEEPEMGLPTGAEGEAGDPGEGISTPGSPLREAGDPPETSPDPAADASDRTAPSPAGARAEAPAPLRPAGAAILEGLVTIEGEPAPGLWVDAQRPEGGRTSRTRTGYDGTFRMIGLEAGMVLVTAEWPAGPDNARRRFVQAEAVLETGQATAVHLNFARALADVEGRVTFLDAPAALADVQLLTRDDLAAGEHLQTETDEHGRFRFYDVPPGQAYVQVRGIHLNGTEHFLRQEVVVPPEGLLTIDLDGGGPGELVVRVEEVGENVGGIVAVLPPGAGIAEYSVEQIQGMADLIAAQVAFRGPGPVHVAGLEPGEWTAVALGFDVDVVASDHVTQEDLVASARYADQAVTVPADAPVEVRLVPE